MFNKKKNHKRNLFPASEKFRYNSAAWLDPDSGNIFMIVREVDVPGQAGEPDKSRLVMVVSNAKGTIISEKIIWEPGQSDFWLEDPDRKSTRLNSSHP
jgi:hypothetical protein